MASLYYCLIIVNKIYEDEYYKNKEGQDATKNNDYSYLNFD